MMPAMAPTAEVYWQSLGPHPHAGLGQARIDEGGRTWQGHELRSFRAEDDRDLHRCSSILDRDLGAELVERELLRQRRRAFALGLDQERAVAAVAAIGHEHVVQELPKVGHRRRGWQESLLARRIIRRHRERAFSTLMNACKAGDT